MENTISDKEFYREMVKELIDISKVNSENVKENNKIVQNLAIEIRELKTVMQSKPCIFPEKVKEVQKGWKETSITTYKWIIGALLGLIVGILSAVGLYVK